MDVFSYDIYQKYISDRMLLAPKKGHGQAKKISNALGISTTLFSQIMGRTRAMTVEQASLYSEYVGLNDLETEFFLLLVQMDRAGNESLRKILQKQISRVREQSQKIVHRIQNVQVLEDSEIAIFYSDWYYSAIRQMTAIPGHEDIEAIAEALTLPRKTVRDVMNFLLQTGLCVEEGGKLKLGPSRTHITADSPWIKMHHTNWRYKALEYIKSEGPEKLHYSSPMTLSLKDIENVRSKLLNLIQDVAKIVDPSPSQELMCLNIDWFRVRPGAQ